MPSILFNQIEKSLDDHRNPERAVKMKDYMRGQYEYYGISSPVRKQILKPFIADARALTSKELESFTRKCWKQKEREWQYVAMDLLDKCRKQWTRDYLDLFEYLVITKSWWDTVDWIASTGFGHLFTKFPNERMPYIERWMQMDNMWLERSAIIHQLKYKDAVDFDLLKALIDQKKSDHRFFVQKAIGWSLRQYGKTNPSDVIEFLDLMPELSNLAKREAMKYIK